MVAYNFKPRFVAPIRDRTKRQTIRARGKRAHARPGGLVQLYTGMRTRVCHKIVPDVVCESVVPVRFDLRSVEKGAPATSWPPSLVVGDVRLLAASREVFAEMDGFDGFADMVEFWLAEHGPILFEGVCIRWREAAP